MCESLVRLCHLVGIVTLFNGSATVIIGIKKLRRQLLRHCMAGPAFSKPYDPSYCQGISSFRANLNRHLVGSTTHPPAFHLNAGTHIFHGRLENGQRLFIGV